MNKFNRTHYGKLHGIPIYIDMTTDPAPGVEAKNWAWGIALDIMEMLYGVFIAIHCLADPEFEPHYAIRVDGEVEQESQNQS